MTHLAPSHASRPIGDVIFTLNREAQEKAKSGRSVVNATIGAAMRDDGTLATFPSALAAVRGASDTQIAAYAPIAGDGAFLNAVRTDMLATVPELLESSVAVATPGGTGALRHALMNYLEHGQAMLTGDYFWGPYSTLADEHGRKVRTFRLFGADGCIDTDSLSTELGATLAAQGRALVFINDPCNNPTGYSMQPKEWRAVVAALLAHAEIGPVTLLVDTAYLEYSKGDTRAFLNELTPLLGRVGLLFAWSGSKAFALYGARVGALIACVQDTQVRIQTDAALAYACRGTWSNCNHAGMAAVTRMLVDPALRASLAAEREVVRKDLFARADAFNMHAKSKGLQYPRYEGGFFVTVFNAEAETKAASMREQDVYVVPAKGALRVALCSVAERDIARLVEALA